MDLHREARSLKGHAATAGVDKWVMIQDNTFRNWVNEQLKNADVDDITNFETDFDDGVRLCALIAALQGKNIRSIKNPKNHHQQLANVAGALSAIADDNIRLVNIGPEDIVNGNLKLILGLVWHLILRYQIGKSKAPTKKLMLAWLQAVIPECNITNFTSDWNDGIALHALIDFCQPGLCPDWRNLSRSDGLGNCRNAMTLAKDNFDIPLVVRPEDLSSTDLDELSGMTYLSYFMKVDSPGYKATLSLVRRLLRSGTVTNFTTDWSDGRLLCNLVTSVGGHVTGWPAMTGDPIENMQAGMNGAKGLSIEPLLSAREMCDPEVDHIAIMAYAAYFRKYKPIRSAAEKVVFASVPQNVSVGQQAQFSITIEDEDVSAGDIRADVQGPDSNSVVHFNWVGKTGEGYFVPNETGLHRLNVYCEGQVINGCPASFKVLADRSKVTFSSVDSCALGNLTELQVNSAAAGGDGDVRIEARSPSGRTLTLSAVPRHGGNYSTNFNPTEVGEWEISVLYDDDHISGSPYTVSVYDPSAVKVYGLEGGTPGMALTFSADTTRAGRGRVHAQVEHQGRYVSSYVSQENDGLYKIDFTPEGAGEYTVQVYFNDTEVRGSPYTVNIADSSNITLSGDGLSLVPVHRTASFDVTGAVGSNLKVDITAPNGLSVPFKIEEGSNSVKVEYVPTEVGDHRIEVKYADVDVSGSPFVAKAYNTAAIKVTPIPDGVVGQAIDFGIDVTQAGEGQLEIMVNNGNLPNTVESDVTGVYKLSFVPEEAGRQTVDIIFNAETHPDCPIVCNAVDLSKSSVRGLDLQLPVDRVATFYVESESARDDINATVDVISPGGDRVNASVYREGSSEFRVEWTPRVSGRHTVDVLYDGRQVGGSPFYVDVFDLSLIRVDNFRHGNVGDEAGFSVDFSVAGTLDQEVKIINPSGHEVVYDGRDLGYMWKDYIYEPEEPGKYKIFVKYGGFELPGCPFTQDVDDGGLPTASGSGLYFAEEDKTANFNVEVGKRRGEIRVSVSGPNSIAKCSVDPVSDGSSYNVTYIPVETGIFDINVTWNGQDIPGSPYHPKVVDVRKVRVIGGWQHFMDTNERVNLVVGEKKQLPFDCSEAGPGSLRAEVQGPSRAIDVDIDTHMIGRTVVEFTPEEEGSHYIHLFWSDLPLVSSPFHGYAVQHTPDASKLILTGRGLKEATVREEAEFYIDGSQAGPGTPDVVLSGVRAEVDVRCVSVGNGKFRCTYVPTIPGAYLLHITWNGRQLRGSPYKVNIIGAFYPNRVVVTGEGLRGGMLGREMSVQIDTRKAGPGELTAYCMGPTQVAYCELQDNQDGTFKLGVRPQEAGRHVLQIKYGGEHVQNSPFAFKVTSQPDASKVRVSGPGVEHGILATFMSRFIVETRGAGAGQLTVRIRGPKGAFQVEMYRDSQRDRTILCRYDPTECGLYIVSVKWSGVDVPGSPFHIHICDTQEELEHMLNEVSYSMGSHGTGSHPSQFVSTSSQPRMVYGQWREQL